MSNKTRKLIWSVPVLAVFAVAAALAAFVVAGTGNPDLVLADDADVEGSATRTAAMFDNSSESASAGVELTLTIPNLPVDLLPGSSIELYLEDDYVVPGSIDRGSVYFIVSDDPTNPYDAVAGYPAVSPVNRDNVTRGGRHYPTDAIEIDTDAHFTAQKSDYAIQVFVPDFNPDTTVLATQGIQVAKQGQQLVMVIQESAGIKNPSEQGTHSVAFSILGPSDDANERDTGCTRNTAPPALDANSCDGGDFYTVIGVTNTLAKISLSDEDNKRGYELTVTGSGFNNGTTAEVYVNHYTESQAAKLDNGAMEAALCQEIIDDGSKVGEALVGSDDKVSVTFEVTVPIFGVGFDGAEGRNYICMKDGENRQSNTDVERFDLESSIRVVPTEVSAGDTVTVYAQDFPANLGFGNVKLAGTTITGASGRGTTADGSATATFTMPGNFSGTVRVDATWGTIEKDTKITAGGAGLSLSKTEVLPLESITIRGNDFSTASCTTPTGATTRVNEIKSITIDGANMELEDGDRIADVNKSNAGQFVFTAIIAEAGDATPITPGKHTIKVVDCNDYTGSASFTVAKPTLTVSPDVAGPRDTVQISGTNWPVDNDKSDINVRDVDITIDFGSDEDTEDAEPDVNGSFSISYRVDKDVTIPSTVQVRANYNLGDIIEIGSFSVPSATLKVAPASAAPGDTVTLSASGLAPFESEIAIKVGGTLVSVPTGTFVDRDGNLSLEAIVPGLDAGLYTVQVDVGDSDDATVTIGELTVLTDVQIGVASALPGALDDLGDNLVRVFYFNNVDKSWSFYDPRDEFAELNTLTELVAGQSYWILVDEDQKPTLNGKVRDFTCVGGECWNSIVW